MFLCMPFLFPLSRILFLCVFLVAVFGFLLSLYFRVFLVGGIGRCGVFLVQWRFLFVFLFCSPMWVVCLLGVVFGCLVGFWLCVEQFLF